MRLFQTLAVLLASTACLSAQQAGTSPVKIFILAGQSNMEGQGEISPVGTPGTLRHTVANDSAGTYQFVVDGASNWVVRDDVWIRDESPAQGRHSVSIRRKTLIPVRENRILSFICSHHF